MKIIIAAVQMRSEPEMYDQNIQNAEEKILEAVRKGAQLIVLPELFASGYIPNEKIRDWGETEEGRTICWMRKTAKKYNIHLGGGVAIFSGAELYNRFYLISSSGQIEGFAQKDNGEAYCFKREEGIYHINSSLGSIAVGICADNHYVNSVRKIQSCKADLLLMPHAWPTVKKQSAEVRDFIRIIRDIMRIPVVFVNPVGTMDKMRGLLGKIMGLGRFALRGGSAIVQDSNTLFEQGGDTPAVLVEEVDLNSRSEKGGAAGNYSGSIVPGSAFIRKVIIPIDIAFGKRFYKKNTGTFRTSV